MELPQPRLEFDLSVFDEICLLSRDPPAPEEEFCFGLVVEGRFWMEGDEGELVIVELVDVVECEVEGAGGEARERVERERR